MSPLRVVCDAKTGRARAGRYDLLLSGYTTALGVTLLHRRGWLMSPAGDDRLADIRQAQDRLAARGVVPTEENMAAELHVSRAVLHALMRQLFSEGRRVADEE